MPNKEYCYEEIRFYVVAKDLNEAISKGDSYYFNDCLPKLLEKVKKEKKEDKNYKVPNYKNYTLVKIEVEKEMVVF